MNGLSEYRALLDLRHGNWSQWIAGEPLTVSVEWLVEKITANELPDITYSLTDDLRERMAPHDLRTIWWLNPTLRTKHCLRLDDHEAGLVVYRAQWNECLTNHVDLSLPAD